MPLPITFEAIYQQRVWGGRQLESVYGRALPDQDHPYGESWEVSDRSPEQSVVNHGTYAGKSLNQLWTEQRSELFGDDLTGDRFPLLIKILDCRADLSIQVHPPEDAAKELGGEAKTEMWYIAAAEPGSKLYVGLKQGTTRETFAGAIQSGTVADHVHAISPQAGESIFIESGRLHAIGAGFLIYEIQQNSDTTYRVFDWNRQGLDGKPRQLHIEESLKCIDFEDYEPSMDTPRPTSPHAASIADCEHFSVEQLDLTTGASIGNPQPDRFSIVTVVSGALTDHAGRHYKAGDFLLLPRAAEPLTVSSDCRLLQTTIPYSE